MQDNRISYLFERYLNGSSTAQEDIELSTYILAPEHTETIERLKEELWTKTKGEPMEEAEAEKHIQRIVQPFFRKASFFSWKRIAVAASLVLAISTASYFVFFRKEDTKEQLVQAESKGVEAPKKTKATITIADGQTVSIDSLTSLTQNTVSLVKTVDGRIVYSGNTNEVIYNTLTNPRGSMVVDMQLSDGSHVWLNAGSSVTYPAAFIGNERIVTITGEAYFEVAPNPQMPFKVRKGNMEVTVLGTHFNVNAYDDDPDMKITLLEGSVKVYKGNENVQLKPGQQAKVTDQISIDEHVNIDEVMAWKEGYFKFRNADIETIMRQIERWYDVDVTYESKSSQQFEAEIPRSVNAGDFFKILEATGWVHFKMDGRKIIVMK